MAVTDPAIQVLGLDLAEGLRVDVPALYVHDESRPYRRVPTEEQTALRDDLVGQREGCIVQDHEVHRIRLKPPHQVK
jgi:hypothetical protein